MAAGSCGFACCGGACVWSSCVIVPERQRRATHQPRTQSWVVMHQLQINREKPCQGGTRPAACAGYPVRQTSSLALSALHLNCTVDRVANPGLHPGLRRNTPGAVQAGGIHAHLALNAACFVAGSNVSPFPPPCWLQAGGACSWLAPLPETLRKPPPSSTLYLARDGTPLRHLLNEDGTRSAPPVKYAEIPPTLVHAVLAAEDKRFFSHGGIDPLAIACAAWDNAQAKRIVSGASTIHQQLIKNTTPRSGKRTLGIKIVEALQARRLAMSWSREDVLTAYLNRISFGNLMTGAATAASGYFQ